MIKCVNCGIEVNTLYHIYNETNYCLSTCENCGKICDKYVEWEIPLIIIDLFLFKTQVYRHLIYNHSQLPSIHTNNTSVTVTDPTYTNTNTNTNKDTNTRGTNGEEKNSNEIASVTNFKESTTNTTPKGATGTKDTKGYNNKDTINEEGVNKDTNKGSGEDIKNGIGCCGTRQRNGKILLRIILLLISATILDSYSMLTSCNYLTNTPNICFPQFQSYNQTLLNYIILYFKSSNTYNHINSQDEILDMIEKMSSIMLYYSRLNIFKRVGMNAEYCKRIYNRTMEFLFLIFLQNPTLSSHKFFTPKKFSNFPNFSNNLGNSENKNLVNKFDCKNITEIGIISLSILRVLSYSIFIILFYILLYYFKLYFTPVTVSGTTTTGTTTSTNTSEENLSNKVAAPGPTGTRFESQSNNTKDTNTKDTNTKDTISKDTTEGEGARTNSKDSEEKNTNEVAAELDTVTEKTKLVNRKIIEYEIGLIGILNIFYALLLSFHIKSLVLMINVWYPTDTILIVIELYIYLNHIIELKVICNISLVLSIIIIIIGAIIKIHIYFLWFHIINNLNPLHFYQ